MLMLVPGVSEAQTAGGNSKVFFDLNLFGMSQSGAKETTFSFDFETFDEAATISATYPKPKRTNNFIGSDFLDLGGGFMFHRNMGAGVNYSLTAYEDPATLTARIPHPVFFNAHGTGTASTADIPETACQCDDPLRREEQAINVFFVYAPVRTSNMELKFYGGPTFFSYKADMVFDMTYTQDFSFSTTFNQITITEYELRKDVKGSGIGYNVGGDFNYFFSRIFGVGAGFRFTQGDVEVDEEPMSEQRQDIRVGGLLIYTGVRFRF
jgi:hypothetical protein